MQRLHCEREEERREVPYKVTEIESKGEEGVAITCCCCSANKGLKEYFVLFLLY